MPDLTPCILERKRVPRPWGGRELKRVLGIELGDEPEIGETWEVYDRQDGSSRLRGSDATLRDLMTADRRALLGHGVETAPSGHFPLLIKYLDARTALSVQVHPGDEQGIAAGDWGKSEAWLVLDVGDRGRIIRGLRQGVTLDDVRARADDASIEELLVSFRPEVGQVMTLPAGTVHSIGPDVVVFEVQQNSDVTYRLHDWGRGRELHVNAALEAIRFDRALDEPTLPAMPASDGQWLIREPYFGVRRYLANEPLSLETEGSVKVLNVLRGFGTLGWHSGGDDPPLPLRQGDTVLVPATTGAVFASPASALELLWTDPGGSR